MKMKSKRGVSLVELMIALAMGGLVMLLASQTTIFAGKTAKRSTYVGDASSFETYLLKVNGIFSKGIQYKKFVGSRSFIFNATTDAYENIPAPAVSPSAEYEFNVGGVTLDIKNDSHTLTKIDEDNTAIYRSIFARCDDIADLDPLTATSDVIGDPNIFENLYQNPWRPFSFVSPLNPSKFDIFCCDITDAASMADCTIANRDALIEKMKDLRPRMYLANYDATTDTLLQVEFRPTITEINPVFGAGFIAMPYANEGLRMRSLIFLNECLINKFKPLEDCSVLKTVYLNSDPDVGNFLTTHLTGDVRTTIIPFAPDASESSGVIEF